MSLSVSYSSQQPELEADAASTVLFLIDALENPLLAVAECGRLQVQDGAPVMFVGEEDADLESAALRAGASVFLACPVIARRIRAYAHRYLQQHDSRGRDSAAPPLCSNALVRLHEFVTFDPAGHRLFVDGACAEVVVRRYDAIHDYAMIRVDRPVLDRAPVKVSVGRLPLEANSPIFTIGHPSGVPQKVSSNATVNDPRRFELDYFTSHLDTLPGPSEATAESRTQPSACRLSTILEV